MNEILKIELCSYCENNCPTIDFPCIAKAKADKDLCVFQMVRDFYNNWQEEKNLIEK